MLSIENFYFALHQHLLNPTGIYDAMYHRFGSIDSRDLVLGRYLRVEHLYGMPGLRLPWCYYFDQEPLDASTVEQCPVSNVRKTFKMLANSEHSILKNHLLKEQNYYDWYYFFHGFAALDWYRDARYFKHTTNWQTPYLCMNRLYANDRSYRLNLVARLISAGIIDSGSVSLNLQCKDYGNWQDELSNPYTRLSKSAIDLVEHTLPTLSRPLCIDNIENSNGNLSASFGHQEFEIWQNSLWHVVTETVFYHNKQHLTEKIFKPIVSKRPFLLAAAPGNLAYLKSYGFKTFDRWIDESYDNIQDEDQRLQAIVDQLVSICSRSKTELEKMHQEMQEILDHNFDHFWGDFKHTIVNELVDNFETAVRLWNNGRFDQYIIPLENANLSGIKKLLLE
jgi:hypothetical protein